jgi:hypothetical protein
LSSKGLRACSDVSPAAWIASRLGGAFGAVTRTVPRGYSAYARICHPPGDVSGALTTWSHVAQATGRRAHPLMQWHALSASGDASNTSPSRWPGASPRIGHLIPEVLGPLCDLLAGHTGTRDDCYFGLWEGWGSNEPIPPPRQAEPLGPVLVRLPGREYLLLSGPLHAARDLGDWLTADWFQPQSPSIFWPSDRAWFAATEIDFDSTLVGGSSQLVEALLAAPTLDSWRVGPDDSLAVDADRINPGP